MDKPLTGDEKIAASQFTNNEEILDRFEEALAPAVRAFCETVWPMDVTDGPFLLRELADRLEKKR